MACSPSRPAEQPAPGQRSQSARSQPVRSDPRHGVGEQGQGRGALLGSGAAGAAVHVRAHVVAGHPGDHLRRDAEEGAHPVRRDGRVVAQLPVAQQKHLLPVEQRGQVRELLPVATLGGVVPEVRPAGVDAALLVAQRRQEVGLRFQARAAQVRPVRVGPLHRVAQHRDQPGAGQQPGDPVLRDGVVEVEHRRRAAARTGWGGVEQRLVVGTPPHVLTPGRDVAGAAAGGGRRTVGEEELRFLRLGQEQLRMAGQRTVQRGDPDAAGVPAVRTRAQRGARVAPGQPVGRGVVLGGHPVLVAGQLERVHRGPQVPGAALAHDHRVLHRVPVVAGQHGAPGRGGQLLDGAGLRHVDPPVLGVRCGAGDVEPPPALLGTHQRGPFERLGAEAVLGDLGDRGDGDAVGRPRQHHREAAALAERGPQPVGEHVAPVTVGDGRRGARPVPGAVPGRCDGDGGAVQTWRWQRGAHAVSRVVTSRGPARPRPMRWSTSSDTESATGWMWQAGEPDGDARSGHDVRGGHRAGLRGRRPAAEAFRGRVAGRGGDGRPTRGRPPGHGRANGPPIVATPTAAPQPPDGGAPGHRELRRGGAVRVVRPM
ncbi:hypothetical protein XF36_17810 [Pseudonocardia sp. HH130629-09]|nr:hypothetical protein XF36_17810 [Pseudonocardia sp. HH130629-09]